jgi:uncharacterized membrane protein
MSRPSKKPKRPPKKSFTLFFLRGLGALLPLVLTIFIFVTLINFVRTYVTTPINSTIYWSLESNGLGWKVLHRLSIDPYDPRFIDVEELPTAPTNLKARYEEKGAYDPDFLKVLAEERTSEEGFFRDLDKLSIDREKLRDTVSSVVHPLIGILVSMLIVLWLGWIVTGFVGRKLLQKFDQALLAIPGFRAVYPYMKQLVEFFISDTELEFDTVVAVPYPNRYIMSIGFVTSQSLKSLRESTGWDLVSIFIPSSPMPMTGYTIHVRKKDLTVLPITIDEALRITVSGGVLVPPHEFVGVGMGDEEEEHDPRLDKPGTPAPPTDPADSTEEDPA